MPPFFFGGGGSVRSGALKGKFKRKKKVAFHHAVLKVRGERHTVLLYNNLNHVSTSCHAVV